MSSIVLTVLLAAGLLASQQSELHPTAATGLTIDLVLGASENCAKPWDFYEMRFDATVTYQNTTTRPIELEYSRYLQIVTARSSETLRAGGFDIDETGRFERFGIPIPKSAAVVDPGRSLTVKPWVGVLIYLGSDDTGLDVLRPGGTYYVQLRNTKLNIRSNIVPFSVAAKPVVKPGETCVFAGQE